MDTSTPGVCQSRISALTSSQITFADCSSFTIVPCLNINCLQCFDAVGWAVAWLSVSSEVMTCIWPSWCHCHSLSLASVKSRLVLPFWYRLTRVVPDKGSLNVCVCVCVSVELSFTEPIDVGNIRRLVDGWWKTEYFGSIVRRDNRSITRVPYKRRLLHGRLSAVRRWECQRRRWSDTVCGVVARCALRQWRN